MSWFRRKPATRNDLIATNVSVAWTDCCGYVPNNQGVGAPVYLLVQDEHLSQVETTIHEQEDTP